MRVGMKERNKSRLYVALQYRGAGRPGYHVGLLLVPKHESPDPNTKGAYRYHATNSFAPHATIGKDGRPFWRYEHGWVKSTQVENIVARVLVAKLPGCEFQQQALRIAREVEHVVLVQENSSWRCHHWLWAAMDHLRALGPQWETIPHVEPGGEIERLLNEAGDEGKERRFGSDSMVITEPGQIFTVDMRQRSTSSYSLRGSRLRPSFHFLNEAADTVIRLSHIQTQPYNGLRDVRADSTSCSDHHSRHPVSNSVVGQ